MKRWRVHTLTSSLRRRLVPERLARRGLALTRARRGLLAGLVIGVIIVSTILMSAVAAMDAAVSDLSSRLDGAESAATAALEGHLGLVAVVVLLSGLASLVLGALVVSRMIKALRERDQELSDHAADLELRVRERTSELSAARDDAALRLVELAQAQAALAASSRQAGRADAARRVLHEIGNVLNSVGTSSTTVDTLLTDDGVAVFARLVDTLERVDDLSAFVRDDPRGPQLRPLLRAIAGRLVEREGRLRDEARRLTEHLEQLQKIIAAQNSATRASKRVGKRRNVVTGAPLVLRDVVARAVEQARQRVADTSSLGVAFEIALGPAGDVRVDGHRVGEILHALLENAAAAVARAQSPGRVTVEARWDSGDLELSVHDDGDGVAEGAAERIFAQGYSTDQGAAGLGLHTAANLAAELGGSIACRGDAPSHRGACFTIVIPTGPPRTRDNGPRGSAQPLDPDAVIAALTPRRPQQRPGAEPVATRPRGAARRETTPRRLVASAS